MKVQPPAVELPADARAIYDRAKEASDALDDAYAERDRMSDNEFGEPWDDDLINEEDAPDADQQPAADRD